MPKMFQNKRIYTTILLLLAVKFVLMIASFIELEFLDSETMCSFAALFSFLLLLTGNGGFLWTILSIIYLVVTLALPVFYVLFAINQTGARFAAVIFLVSYIAEIPILVVSALFSPLLLLGVLFNLVVIGLLIHLLRNPVP